MNPAGLCVLLALGLFLALMRRSKSHGRAELLQRRVETLGTFPPLPTEDK